LSKKRKIAFNCYCSDDVVGTTFKGPEQCFSMQVLMNKCFLLNTEKNLAQICLVVFEKNSKTAQLRRIPIPKKWRHRAEG